MSFELLFYAGAGVLFGAVEHAFPARAQRHWRPQLWTDVAFYCGQVLAFNGAVVAVLVWLHGVIQQVPVGAVRGAFSSMPFAAQAVTAMLLSDLCIYWFHRLEHRVEWLWRFHRVHHTAETLDWAAAFREHPVDGLLTRLVENLPPLLLGFPLEAIAGFVAFRGLWGLFIHSNVGLRLGPFESLLGAPRLHHWHHDRARNNAVNFANLNPIMDRLFGTFHDPQGPAPRDFGVNEAAADGYVGLLVEPFGVFGGRSGGRGGVRESGGVTDASRPRREGAQGTTRANEPSS